ncbi:hypothetical protein AMS68_006896 [Peltaster fructicola]|uniref:Heterokaryon incompatibility domain-containing protein n=1 Tax=Peltaster fructicola TaxID=286661 RepID=A0A6H0Y3E7_9PEZI|nr:hypothetical protein AMS68_006896 [Peltaster fructicola]
MATTMWSVVWPLAAASTYAFALSALKWKQLPSWCQINILPDWYIVETRIRQAALTPIQHGLPRGWVIKHSLLGRTIYHDLLTDRQTTRRPAKRPLYEPLEGNKTLKNRDVNNFGMRLLVIVPACHHESPIECLLFSVPMAYYAVCLDRPSRRDSYRWRLWRFAVSHLPILKKVLRKGPDPWKSAFGNILSYCWGDPNITEDISINDHSFPITTNLASALRQLRHNSGQVPIFLWVDSICINQQDSTEMAIQFKLMSYFYGIGHTVHCWLGKVDDVAARDRFFDVHLQTVHELGGFNSIASISRIINQTYTPTELEADILCLRTIASLPYWSRKWIIQEVVLAKRLKVYIGDRTMTMRHSYDLAKALRNLERGLDAQSRYVNNIAGHDEFVEVFRQYPLINRLATHSGLLAGARFRELSQGKLANKDTLYQELPGILERLRLSTATRPKDAILGLTALLEAEFQLNVSPEMDCMKIYYMATACFMTTSNTLRLLYQARFMHCEDGLPSYTIDFSPPKRGTTFLKGNGWLRQASAGSRVNFKIFDNGWLQTATFQLGTVTAVWKAEPDPDAMPSRREAIHSHAWTRARYLSWKAWLDVHDPDPDHRFQWDFLLQGIVVVSADRGIDRAIRPEEVSDFEETFNRYIAGGEGVDYAAKLFLDNLTFFVTEHGQHGMTQPEIDVRPGDSVVTVASTPVPFLVRDINPDLFCSHCKAVVRGDFYACNTCVDYVFIVCEECLGKGCRCEQPDLSLAAYAYEGKKIRRLSPARPDNGGLDLLGRGITLLGACYLHGAMTGDAVRAAARERFGDETRVDDVFERTAIY